MEQFRHHPAGHVPQINTSFQVLLTQNVVYIVYFSFVAHVFPGFLRFVFAQKEMPLRVRQW